MSDHGGDAVAGVEDEPALLSRNGIIKVTVHQYLVENYRYSSLADALAQVRRATPEWRAKMAMPTAKTG